MRSSNLESALQEFFDGTLKPGTSFVDAFYAHPLVQTLSKGQDGRPSYIQSEIVAQVVQALVTASGTATSLAAAVNAMPGTPETNRIKGLVDALVTQAAGDAAAFRKAVETHFNATMERASGWFKRRTQSVALIAAAVLVIGANVDTVELAQSLASNPAARLKLVEIAQQNVKDGGDGAVEARQALKDAESHPGVRRAAVWVDKHCGREGERRRLACEAGWPHGQHLGCVARSAVLVRPLAALHAGARRRGLAPRDKGREEMKRHETKADRRRNGDRG